MLVISSWRCSAVKGHYLRFLPIDFSFTMTCAPSFIYWHRQLAACWLFYQPEWEACDSRCVSFNVRSSPFPGSRNDWTDPFWALAFRLWTCGWKAAWLSAPIFDRLRPRRAKALEDHWVTKKLQVGMLVLVYAELDCFGLRGGMH